MEGYMKNFIDIEDTALIVIDMQNDFCHEDGVSGRNGIADIQPFQTVVPQIDALISQARECKVPVIFVKMTLDASTISEAWRNRWSAPMTIVEKGAWGSEFYKLFPQEGDYVVEKHRYSAFIGTNLDLILRSLQRKSIILTGVLTNICVESTARDGFMLDYNVTLVEDGCAGSSTESHNASLANLAMAFGQVMKSTDILGSWSKNELAGVGAEEK
jgi:ureidoacrylate peracid hydrolase